MQASTTLCGVETYKTQELMMAKKDSVGTEIVWWEKSVEYTFIAEMVARDMFTWAAPLSGKPETALGDAIMEWDGNLLLIEFKRDAKCLSSEFEKYSYAKDFASASQAYRKAQAVLVQHSGVGAHGLVYGELIGGKLGLRALPYWETDSTPLDIDTWCGASRVSLADFDDYLGVLSDLRAEASDAGSTSSGSSSFVVGVGKNGKSFALDLTEYKALRPALSPKPQEELRSTPSFGF